MTHARWIAAAIFAVSAPSPVLAQDETIVITASRNSQSDTNIYFDEGQAAIGLTQRADFFVKPIFINSDSRDETMRRDEVLAMLRETITRANQEGIVLVAGQYSLQPLTLANFEELPMGRGTRPDTTRVQIYARLPLEGANPRASAADDRIARFIQAIPVTGRSFIETGSTNLALNNPQQYRAAVVQAIAAEATRYAGFFGSNYGVEIRGLESDLFWQQASETEVFLYIEHNFVIRPR
jgi:hypothetical protein